jgi:hypothetical protein
MKIKISELKSNPFKQYINEGKLDEYRLDILKESIDHGTLPEHFFVRRQGDELQITSGHHRLGALKQVKGSAYPVDVTMVNFSDEQMLVDMVRENITQRDTDFHDTAESIDLARHWLQSGCQRVNQFNTLHKEIQKGKKDFQVVPDSFHSIAKFLSKNGKAVSYVTVKKYLDIKDKLPSDIYDKIERKDHATAEHDSKDKETIGITEAYAIASASNDESEQRQLIEALKNSKEQYWNNQKGFLTAYKAAPDEVKQKVLSGEIDIADIEDATIKIDVEEYNKENPRFTFIPNFAGRLRDFNKDVRTLEKQINAFKTVFHSEQFREKYHSLNKKQQLTLTQLINNIQDRIKKCSEEVDFFIERLSDKELLEG